MASWSGTIYGEVMGPYSPITYIYALTDENECVRYIGKSDTPIARACRHAKTDGDTRKDRWLRKILDRDDEFGLQILEVCAVSRWQKRERYWIAFFRRAGADLVNSTAGGRGPLAPTAVTRAKMRAAAIRRGAHPGAAAKISATLRGRPKPPRTRQHNEKIAAAMRGRPQTIEQKMAATQARRRQLCRRPSQFKGVYLSRERSRYEARISVGGKSIFLGRFSSALEAARAYDVAARANGWPPEGLNGA